MERAMMVETLAGDSVAVVTAHGVARVNNAVVTQADRRAETEDLAADDGAAG